MKAEPGGTTTRAGRRIIALGKVLAFLIAAFIAFDFFLGWLASPLAWLFGFLSLMLLLAALHALLDLLLGHDSRRRPPRGDGPGWISW